MSLAEHCWALPSIELTRVTKRRRYPPSTSSSQPSSSTLPPSLTAPLRPSSLPLHNRNNFAALHLYCHQEYHHRHHPRRAFAMLLMEISSLRFCRVTPLAESLTSTVVASHRSSPNGATRIPPSCLIVSTPNFISSNPRTRCVLENEVFLIRNKEKCVWSWAVAQ